MKDNTPGTQPVAHDQAASRPTFPVMSAASTNENPGFFHDVAASLAIHQVRGLTVTSTGATISGQAERYAPCPGGLVGYPLAQRATERCADLLRCGGGPHLDRYGGVDDRLTELSYPRTQTEAATLLPHSGRRQGRRASSTGRLNGWNYLQGLDRRAVLHT